MRVLWLLNKTTEAVYVLNKDLGKHIERKKMFFCRSPALEIFSSPTGAEKEV